MEITRAAVATLEEVMAMWGTKYSIPETQGYLFPYDPLVFDKVDAKNFGATTWKIQSKCSLYSFVAEKALSDLI